MTVLSRRLFNSYSSLIKRCFHSTSLKKSYEGEGKTTVTILNKNYEYGLMVDGVYANGFQLNNGVRILGPMVIFPKTLLAWNIASSADINEESLSLLLNLEPKLDVLVIGLDAPYPHNATFLLNLRDTLKKYKISSEILPIFHACSTFNFLNSEQRYVAAALIPPKVEFVKKMKEIGHQRMKQVKDPFEDSDVMEPKYVQDFRVINKEIEELEKEKEDSLKPKPAFKDRQNKTDNDKNS